MTYPIEHAGNTVFAVITADGPAIYPSLDDGDREYYDSRTWHPVNLDEFVPDNA